MSFPVRKHFPTLGVTSPHMTDRSVARQQKAVHGVDEHPEIGIVTEAQQLLHGFGDGEFGSFNPGKIDGNYGSSTGQAARRAHFWLGYRRRRVNGHFGPELRAYLLPKSHQQHAELPRGKRARRHLRRAMKHLPTWFKPAPKSLGQKMYDIAHSQLGVSESPAFSNHVRYTAWYGLIGPWCAMFLSWVADQAGSHLPEPRSRWASVAAVVSDARARRNGLIVVSASQVKRGDWAGYHFTENFQHIGMFDSWIVFGHSFWSIDGNTTPTPGSGSEFNGGVVARRERFVANVHDFIRVTA